MQLHITTGAAKHFLGWELPEWAKRFELVDAPSEDALLLSFGPDALDAAATMPARARFAVLFPGFSKNPVRDLPLRDHQVQLLREHFTQVFINSGPLEIAYREVPNLSLYPFSVDVEFVGFRRFRTSLDRLLHVSNDNAQKDWRRSESIMVKTGLPFEVYPPRDRGELERAHAASVRSNRRRRRFGLAERAILPVGYVDHASIVRKYHEYDGFVHVARDVRHPTLIDGKVTASLIEAGVSGALLFWHDTWSLGNGLATVFDLPVSTSDAASEILQIRSSIDVERHSRATREEMIDTFNPHHSVAVRADRMIELIS